MPDDAKRVAIVGGGFAGVDTARTLRRRLPPGWEVVHVLGEGELTGTYER